MHTVTETLRARGNSQREYTYLAKVDAAEALARYNSGESLRQIAASIGPGVSHLAVYRAILRAVRAGGVRISHPPKEPTCAQR